MWFKQTKLVILIICTTTLLSQSGCSYVKDFQAAQDSFNKAATLDNTMKFKDFENMNMTSEELGNDMGIVLTLPSGEEPQSLPTQDSLINSYRNSLEQITKVINKSKSKLQKDALLGNALTIKSLSEWKLGDYDNAAATAQQAVRELKRSKGKIETQPRDLAIMTAMPGLIKSNEAYDYLQNTIMGKQPQKDFDGIKNILISALKDFNRATKTAPKTHPVQVYLATTSLAAYNTWNIAADELLLDNDEKFNAERTIIKQKANKLLAQLGKLIKKEQEAQQFMEYWKSLLVL